MISPTCDPRRAEFPHSTQFSSTGFEPRNEHSAPAPSDRFPTNVHWLTSGKLCSAATIAPPSPPPPFPESSLELPMNTQLTNVGEAKSSYAPPADMLARLARNQQFATIPPHSMCIRPPPGLSGHRS